MDLKLIILLSLFTGSFISNMAQRERDHKLLSEIYTLKFNYIIPMK